MLLYAVVIEVLGLGGLALGSLRIPLCMSAIWVIWVAMYASPLWGVRFSEGYVGPCLAFDHITGALVGFVVVDDASV